jgi:hypothetical protein
MWPIKALAIMLLCIVSIAILLKVVVPAASLVLGLGIDLPKTWARKFLFLYSHPLSSLLVAIFLLVLSAWGVFRLMKL